MKDIWYATFILAALSLIQEHAKKIEENYYFCKNQ